MKFCHQIMKFLFAQDLINPYQIAKFPNVINSLGIIENLSRDLSINKSLVHFSFMP